MTTSSIPWVEKYRPTELSGVVLDKYNKQLLDNIIETNHFPNLLFYGPPGTGKTTTIINLIEAYQARMNQKHKELMIHLNASDERGIDIIRNQIASFVDSSGLFNMGMRFVVLDEVDYMTKNAQQALKYLLQNYNKNVRYCLICNYISRIDESLQNEFIRLRFNQLPVADIVKFLNNIIINEQLELDTQTVKNIQMLYRSDIRSMINYIQSNRGSLHEHKILSDKNWELMTDKLSRATMQNNINYINILSSDYGIEKKGIIKQYLTYIVFNRPEYITSDLLKSIENLLHNSSLNTTYFVNYTVLRLMEYYKDFALGKELGVDKEL